MFNTHNNGSDAEVFTPLMLDALLTSLCHCVARNSEYVLQPERSPHSTYSRYYCIKIFFTVISNYGLTVETGMRCSFL